MLSLVDVLLKRLGQRIRDLRGRHGWSQEKFADACRVHRTYMGHLERGEKNVSITSVVRVSDALGITLSELFAGIDIGEAAATPQKSSEQLDRARLLREIGAIEKDIQKLKDFVSAPGPATWRQRTFQAIMFQVPIDRKQLPDSADVLQQMVLDLIAQLDASEARRIKTENLLRQLLAARSGRRSEQISEEQLALFEAELKAQGVNVEDLSKGNDAGNGPDGKDSPASPGNTGASPRGRRALPAHLKRERIVHDLDEAEKHCALCAQDLREFGEQ
jgi:transcriptional regulator with XRE-family HTH domain